MRERERERETDRQRQRQRQRQTDRQTDRQTQRQTDRQSEREVFISPHTSFRQAPSTIPDDGDHTALHQVHGHPMESFAARTAGDAGMSRRCFLVLVSE